MRMALSSRAQVVDQRSSHVARRSAPRVVMAQADLNKWVGEVRKRGLQSVIHANGNEATEMALTAKPGGNIRNSRPATGSSTINM
jgi:predicted amidohydrolase YtcJ